MLVAGDLYETATPDAGRPAAGGRRRCWRCGTRRQVVAIAGNHDNPRQLDAFRPLRRRGRHHPGRGAARAGRRRRLATLTARSGEQRCGWRRCRSCPSGTRCARPRLLTSTAGREHRRLRRPASRRMVDVARRRLRPTARSTCVHRPPDRDRGDARRRRAARRSRSSSTTCRRPRSRPSTHYVALGHLHRRQSVPARPGALLRPPAAGRLRRGGELAGGRSWWTSRADTPAPDHRRAGHRRPAAAHRARHAGRAGRWPVEEADWLRVVVVRAAPGRAARGGAGAAAGRAGGASRSRVPGARPSTGASAGPAGRRSSSSVTTWRPADRGDRRG